MIRRIGLAFGGFIWFVFVFWAVYRLSFPSAAVGERISWEAQDKGNIALSMEGAHPWWVGLGGSEVTLASIDRQGNRSPMLSADHVRARIGLLGLLMGSARVTGDVTMGDGGIDFYVDASQGERGIDLHALELDAEGFPIGALPPVAGMNLEGTGGFDVSAELDAPEGMNKADGHFRIAASEVILEGIPEAEIFLKSFDLFPMVIEEIDIDVDFVEGKGRVEAGRIVSDLATIDISGQVVLMKRLERSKCDLSFEISPGSLPAPALSMMASAKQDNGKYKYKMSGVCSRATPQAERSRRRPAARPRGGARPARPKSKPRAKAKAPAGRATTPTTDLTGGPTLRGPAGALRTPDLPEDLELDEDELLEDELLDEEGELDEEAPLEPGEEVAPADY